jgi:thioredoxin reductase (NADPH)
VFTGDRRLTGRTLAAGRAQRSDRLLSHARKSTGQKLHQLGAAPAINHLTLPAFITTKGEDVYVVGGGNSAGQAAMHFARFARRIHILIRSDSLRSTLSKYLLDRIEACSNIEVVPRVEVVGLAGDQVLEEITIRSRDTGETRQAKTRWLFVCIGGAPNTQWAAEVGIMRDEGGYLVTGPDLRGGGRTLPNWPLDREPFHLETNIPGVFAAGDVRHGAVKRFSSAVGEGSMAVALAHRHLGNY